MATRTAPALDGGPGTDRRPRTGRFSATDLALIAGFAALTAVLAIAPPVYVPGNPAPITLQSLGVMLCGAVLGWKRGGAAILLMLLVGALGVPVLSGGRPVLAALQGPTVGFLIGYVVGAAVVGALVQARLPRAATWWVALACLVGGIGVVYLFGIPGMALRGNLSLPAAAAACLTFIPGDLIKAGIATVVAAAVHRALPGLTPPLRRR
ncbi:MAG: biotin transporter BioY [Austwickia sp.]|nr:biotin transporter BioY [Austwickia sp.]